MALECPYTLSNFQLLNSFFSEVAQTVGQEESLEERTLRGVRKSYKN